MTNVLRILFELNLTSSYRRLSDKTIRITVLSQINPETKPPTTKSHTHTHPYPLPSHTLWIQASLLQKCDSHSVFCLVIQNCPITELPGTSRQPTPDSSKHTNYLGSLIILVQKLIWHEASFTSNQKGAQCVCPVDNCVAIATWV